MEGIGKRYKNLKSKGLAKIEKKADGSLTLDIPKPTLNKNTLEVEFTTNPKKVNLEDLRERRQILLQELRDTEELIDDLEKA
jgi:hypothetical protein